MAGKELNTITGSELMPTLRIGKLTTLTGVNRFHSRVIRMVMRGEMPPEIGAKLSYMLNVQAGIVKDCRILDEFADRIAALTAD